MTMFYRLVKIVLMVMCWHLALACIAAETDKAKAPVDSNNNKTNAAAKTTPASINVFQAIDIKLAKAVDANYVPQQVSTEFTETSDKIYIAFHSKAQHYKAILTYWYAESVVGYRKGQKLFTWGEGVDPGGRAAIWFHAPANGYLPGKYRVEVIIDGNKQAFYFTVVKSFPNALELSKVKRTPAYNLAWSVLGGKLMYASSEYDASKWSARNLNDGPAYNAIWRAGPTCDSCGWSSEPVKKVRQRQHHELIFSFYQERTAVIDSVVLDTRTWETLQQRKGIPKHVEIWVSQTSIFKGFKRVAQARLLDRSMQQLIQFKPVSAKYVKVTILSAHSGNYVQLGEVRIYEAKPAPQKSILHDLPVNIARPAAGGYLVYFTSHADGNQVGQLLDGKVSHYAGWLSAKSFLGPASYLPQEFIFGFRHDRLAGIDSILVSSQAGASNLFNMEGKKIQVKRLVVYVSQQHRFRGYEKLGEFTIPVDARDFRIPVKRKARYVKIKLLANYGGSVTGLGEIKILEDRSNGQQSIMQDNGGVEVPVQTKTVRELRQKVSVIDFDEEIEPNNTPVDAKQRMQPDQFIAGTIKPLNDIDLFRLRIPGKTSQTITFNLLGDPYISTSLSLIDKKQQVIQSYDPSKKSINQVSWSWFVKPGDYYVKLKTEPVSTVLLWDTSGSMKGRADNVRRAVTSYIEQIKSDEYLNLIRFSDNNVQVLLNEFTNDKARLKQAMQGQVYARGGTPLYDALKKGIDLLKQRKGNRAIILLSDGADSESKLKHGAIFHLLGKSQVRVYVIGLGMDLQRFVPEFQSDGRRILQAIADVTNGRALFTPNSEQLLSVYASIGKELRNFPRYFVSSRISQGFGQLSIKASGERIPALSAPSHVHVIFDASGSMKRKIKQQSMMQVARHALVEMLQVLPKDIKVGLRVYGQKVREGRRGACRDTQLLVPFQRNDQSDIVTKVNSIKALGTTPIAYSLQKIPQDFAGQKGELLVVLVTDGKEECGGNPLAVVQRLKASGLKFKLNVVGFALVKKQHIALMRRVAHTGGGRFYLASSPQALRLAIRSALSVNYDVLDDAKLQVASGAVDFGNVSLPEGQYQVRVLKQGRPLFINNIPIKKNKKTQVELKKYGQEIDVHIQRP